MESQSEPHQLALSAEEEEEAGSLHGEQQQVLMGDLDVSPLMSPLMEIHKFLYFPDVNNAKGESLSAFCMQRINPNISIAVVIANLRNLKHYCSDPTTNKSRDCKETG